MPSVVQTSNAVPGDFSAISRKLEQMEVHHITQQAAGYAILNPKSHPPPIKREGHFFGAITRADFGWKLNRVAGFGLQPPVTNEDITLIESSYASIGLTPEFDLGDFTDADMLQLLKERGYVSGASGEIYVNSLDEVVSDTSLQVPKSEDNVLISTVQQMDHAAFIQASIEGYKDTGRPIQLLEALAEIAIARDDTQIFAAWIDGHLAATCAMAIGNVEDMKIALIYLDSTVPEFRGKGIQSKLLRYRLGLAKELGCRYVTLGCKPGAASARNAQRNGFRMAHYRYTYVKSPSNAS